MRSWLRTACLAAALSFCASAPAEPAGKIVYLDGLALISGARGGREAVEGDTVEEGDTVRVERGAGAQVLMTDGTTLRLRGGSEIRISSHKWSGAEDGSEESVIELLRGWLRSVTGSIGRKNRDKVAYRALTVTIGIRGTDFELAIVEPGDAGGDAPGVYSSVNSGRTVMRSTGGELELGPRQSGFVPRSGEAPRAVPLPKALGNRAEMKPGVPKPGAGAKPGAGERLMHRPDRVGEPLAEDRARASGAAPNGATLKAVGAVKTGPGGPAPIGPGFAGPRPMGPGEPGGLPAPPPRK